jgi:hypothetical protein
MRMCRTGRAASPAASLRRALLPAVATVVALAALSACADGGGLRVEGAEPTATSSTSTPPAVLGTSGPGKEKTPARPASLAQIRLKLLADKRLDTYSRTVLAKCVVISRCLSQGPSVDVMHNGVAQEVVFIHTLDKFVFGVFLIALEPAGPRRIWSLKVDQPTINASPQGDLVVESKIFTIDDKVCCPSGRRVEVYRWNGRQMTKVSSQDQKGD